MASKIEIAAARVAAAVANEEYPFEGDFSGYAGGRRPSGLAKAQGIDPFSEIGTTGLRQFGGYVLEEWLALLAGRKAAWVYREMMDNDPIVGAVLFAIKWLARGVEWSVQEGNDAKAAELVESCMNDMEHTWGDFINEALSFLPYGWALEEEVYKKRQGPQNDPPWDVLVDGTYMEEDTSYPASSQFTDGKIGWRRFSVRAQETLLRWGFRGYSSPVYMEQIDWHGGSHKIPLSKALLFRTQTTRNNPEGRSILRNAVSSYFSLKNIKQIEAIGVERDLAGIPVMTPPEGVELFAAGQSTLLAKVQKMVTAVRRDEYEGIVLPSAGWKFELLSAGGSRQFDTDKVVRRYRQDMALSMLADFVLIGQDAVGSYAMVDVKSDLFGVALDGIFDLICEELNRCSIPRLLKLNGMDVSEPPTIKHGSAKKLDLERIGAFLQSISSAGAPIPWSMELLRALFTEAGLPASFKDYEAAEGLPGQQPDPKDDLLALPAAQARAGVLTPKPAATTSGPPASGPQSAGKPKMKAAASGKPRPKGKPKQKGKKANPKKPAKAGVKKAEQPPNFRDTTSKKKNCSTCVFMGPKGMCSRYDWPVKPDDVCDTWSKSVAKADSTRVPEGQIVDIQPALSGRARVLSDQLEQEINAAFGELAEQAATAYLSIAEKASGGYLHRLVARVLSRIDVQGWILKRILPILRNHAGRVASDVQRTVETQINLKVQIAAEDMRRIGEQAGEHLMLRDVEPQVRQSIMQAVKDGIDAGEQPSKIAQRIRGQVPKGRFVHAGSKYRAKLIAKNETQNAMRAASYASMRSNPHITHLRLRDGIYGPPRSDAQCMARDGEIVPISEPPPPNHIACTLSYDPVVSIA